MTRAFFLLALAVAVTYAARSFLPTGTAVTGSGAALAFGFLLIAAIQVGRMAHRIHFPHLTGYLLCGLVFGPEVLRLVTPRMVADLALVKGAAVGLIALMAGCELNFRRIGPQIRAISLISICSIAGAAALLFVFFYWISGILPVTAQFAPAERAAVALVAANVLVAFSPAVVIGVISETAAHGPLSQLCLAVVVVADLLIVVTFSLSSAVAQNVLGATATADGVEVLMKHIFGSILVGIVFGAVLAVYVRRVHVRTGLFVFALLFIAAEAGRALHLNPLLVGLAAGLFLENISAVGGDEVLKATQPVVLPTFAIFFAVIGAEVHLRAFFHVAPFAIAAALLRAGGILVGSRVGCRLARVDRAVAGRVPFGLLPQAGVAIALAVLVLNGFEPWGRVVGTILLGSIVVNELAGPVLFRFALARAGEIPSERTMTESELAPAQA
jgi:Kef-type K+ transport system membrane component KefB